MSLRSEIRAMYGQGLTDPVVRVRLSGRAWSDATIRGSMSKVRRELGMMLRPDLCRMTRQPVFLSLPPAVRARLDHRAAAEGLTRAALAQRFIEAGLADDRVFA